MGNASGKLADVVLYRNAGAQVARLRVRKPKNPRTLRQIQQRVIQSTVAKAYALLRPLCDHAFEGKTTKTQNQSEFMRQNVAKLRRAMLTAGSQWFNLQSFNSKTQVSPLVNAYIIADGSLPPLSFDGDGQLFILKNGVDATITYQGVVDALGLKRGDQLTFVNLSLGDDNTPEEGVMSSLTMARIILEPSDGDMSKAFIGASGAVNLPNAKNEGSFSVGVNDGSLFVELTHPGSVCGVIVSRYEDKWLRSPATLSIMSSLGSANTFEEAVESWLTQVSSDKYLNQAEV